MTERNAQPPAGDSPSLAALPSVASLLAGVVRDLRELLARLERPSPLLVGIHTGGVWLAEHLRSELALEGPVCGLDVSLYRDDYASKGLKPQIRASSLPDSTADRHIVLVDDVIMTGRTIRGAINQLFDYGRPSSVLLVELIDLPARELPVQPDVVGHRLESVPEQRIKLEGPDPLRLVMVDWPETGERP